MVSREPNGSKAMTRTEQITKIIDHCRDGMLTMTECHNKLAEMQVYGGWDQLDFTGYDYVAQRWVQS